MKHTNLNVQNGSLSIFTDLLKVILYIYNVILLVFGLGCIAIGLWLYTDLDVKSYLTVLRRGPDDNVLLAAAALIMAAGFGMAFVGGFGLYSAMKARRQFILIYICILVCIMVLQLTAGFLIVVFRHELHMYVKDGMRRELKDRYEFDNFMGRAWNRVQVRNRCCGVDGSRDYSETGWWYAQNPGVENKGDAEIFVPSSCCILQSNEDRDVKRIDPQKAQPKSMEKCQEDAKGSKDGSNYLNGRGCFAALLDFIERHIKGICGVGLGVGLFQIIGIVAAGMYFRSLRKLSS